MLVRGLQVTIFDLRTLFLVWGYLGTWVKKLFFQIFKILDFVNFMAIFAIFIQFLGDFRW